MGAPERKDEPQRPPQDKPADARKAKREPGAEKGAVDDLGFPPGDESKFG